MAKKGGRLFLEEFTVSEVDRKGDVMVTIFRGTDTTARYLTRSEATAVAAHLIEELKLTEEELRHASKQSECK